MALDGRRRTPAGHAVVVMAVALVAGALINGESLLRTAERQPFGAERDAAVAASRPVRAVGEAFGLHLPRRAIEALAHQEELEAASGFAAGLPVPSAVAAPPVTAAPPGTAPAAPEPPPTEPPPPPRQPTAEDPLRVLFVGDSLIGNISTAFGRVFSDEPRMTVEIDFHISTGLARPDVLDWPTYLDRVLGDGDAEVVVLMFGGNDDQDMQTEGGRVAFGSRAWALEYARRVGIMMDVASGQGRTAVWLGLPAMHVTRLEQARQVMNEVARQQARRRPAVRYVDLARTLTPDGTYQQTVGGIRAREADGVHLTIQGAELVVEDVFRAFARQRLLRP